MFLCSSVAFVKKRNLCEMSKSCWLKVQFVFWQITFAIFLTSYSARAQNIFEDLASGEGGKIVVKHEPAVERLINAAILAGKSGRIKSQGFRIQIYSDYGPSARQNALSVRERFVSLYPDYPLERIYLSYEPPFVKLRVGDYRDESSALIDYKRFVREFLNCYIIKSEIDFPPLAE